MSTSASATMDQSINTEVEKSNKFPPQIKFIVGNEACERFSYYGMRTILMVFMTKTLVLGETKSMSIYHTFMAACYLLPLLGGFLADRYWGKYKTILYLSLLYCVGHGILSLWENETALYWALGFIALGSGGIKPCVSAFVGDQFTDKNKHLVEKVFDVFYFSINFGAFFSSLLTPWLLIEYGTGIAFGIPGVLMAISTLIFWLGRKHYLNTGANSAESHDSGFFKICYYILTHLGDRKPGESVWSVAVKKFGAEKVEAVSSAFDILKVFGMISFFWSLYEQSGSSWVLQAEAMDGSFMGFQIQASQMQAINPIMVMALIPLFAYGVYPLVEKMGYKLTSLRKIGWGMFFAGVSFLTVALLQSWIDAGEKISLMWQMLPYFILTCSEVMVSITGLEFAYSQAHASMKSTVMSFWMLTVFVGNLVTVYVTHMNPFSGASGFLFYAALIVVVAGIFAKIASGYKLREYYAH